MGAFEGWVPLTVGAMWRLGDPAGDTRVLPPHRRGHEGGPVRTGPRVFRPEQEEIRCSCPRRRPQGLHERIISSAGIRRCRPQYLSSVQPVVDGGSLVSDPQTPGPFKERSRSCDTVGNFTSSQHPSMASKSPGTSGTTDREGHLPHTHHRPAARAAGRWTAAGEFQLTPEHQAAVNRQRRIFPNMIRPPTFRRRPGLARIWIR